MNEKLLATYPFLKLSMGRYSIVYLDTDTRIYELKPRSIFDNKAYRQIMKRSQPGTMVDEWTYMNITPLSKAILTQQAQTDVK